MLEIVNRTPYVIALLPYSDKGGRDHAGVVIKGTWSIDAREDPTLAEEQQPIVRTDERYGKRKEASMSLTDLWISSRNQLEGKQIYQIITELLY